MGELKNCENCKHRKIRKSRGYPCMCCELLNPISFNLKWEEEPQCAVSDETCTSTWLDWQRKEG